MVAEIYAGISALKSAIDIAQSLKNINDAAVRNRVAIELGEKLVAAYQLQLALLSRVDELEKEVVRIKASDTEKHRYELKSVGNGAVAYMLKPEARGSEPPHWLCPTCYDKGQKAYFQPSGARMQRAMVYRCKNCDGVLTTESEIDWL